MRDYNRVIKKIDMRVKELSKSGIILPPFKSIYKANQTNILQFLSKQYLITFNKSYDSIEFLKNTKLIKKNPTIHERFTYKKDIDILKIMNAKNSQNQALMESVK